jgi:hypothetical protein
VSCQQDGLYLEYSRVMANPEDARVCSSRKPAINLSGLDRECASALDANSLRLPRLVIAAADFVPCRVFACGYKMAHESQEQSWPIKHH